MSKINTMKGNEPELKDKIEPVNDPNGMSPEVANPRRDINDRASKFPTGRDPVFPKFG